MEFHGYTIKRKGPINYDHDDYPVPMTIGWNVTLLQRVPMSKLFGRFYCKVSGMMCRVRLRNPPVPSPYTVKETLRLKKKVLIILRHSVVWGDYMPSRNSAPLSPPWNYICTDVYEEPPFWIPVSPSPTHPWALLAALSFWKVWLRPWRHCTKQCSMLVWGPVAPK